jgi:hypothetical protein
MKFLALTLLLFSSCGYRLAAQVVLEPAEESSSLKIEGEKSNASSISTLPRAIY